MALAENSGLQPIETLSAVKHQQVKVSGLCGTLFSSAAPFLLDLIYLDCIMLIVVHGISF